MTKVVEVAIVLKNTANAATTASFTPTNKTA